MDRNTTLIACLKAQSGELLARNRLADAASACQQLSRLAPEDVDNWVLLGQILRRLRNLDAAEQCCRRALRLHPNYPPAQLALGSVLQQQCCMESALAYYRAAVHADPEFADAHYYLANALRETGDLQGAWMSYRRVLQLNPNHFECLNNLGILLINLGNGTEAVTHLQNALRLLPDSVPTLTNLGDACVALSRYTEAIRHLQHALRLDPGFANAHRALASALHHAGKMQEALASYKRLAELQPGSTDAVLGQAKILEQLGRYQESYRLLQPLLATGHKGVLPAFFDISHHVGRREEAVAALEDMLKHRAMRNEAVASIHFKLGRHYDEVEDYGQAFHHYRLGNALTPAQFNRERLVRFVDDSIAIYSPAFVQRLPRAANRSKLPVFIVGMPRSGTSLVEQILASHRRIYGAGELPHIGRIVQRLSNEFRAQGFPLCVPNLTQHMLDSSAANHLEELGKLGRPAVRVTDKMPYNFHYLGLISQLFPEAPIIQTSVP
jgi:tetratricopeptide (TPR) repeat protein